MSVRDANDILRRAASVYASLPAYEILHVVLTWLPPGVELMTDVSPADWVVGYLKPWDPTGARLESFVPGGFEAYARIFHPAKFRPARRGVLDPSISRRWADLAREHGLELTPDIAFVEVSGLEPGDDALDEIAPSDENLPPETCDSLAALLRGHSSTPGVSWFCLWDGNGAFWSASHSPLYPADARRDEIARYQAEAEAQDALLKSTPLVEAYARSYFLFRGPLDAACSFEPAGWHTSPNLWWPDDRAWIVETEVDGYSTYVGASRAALDDLLASSQIEAIEVTLDTHMDPEGYPPRWRSRAG
jgi:hypothetical protein